MATIEGAAPEPVEEEFSVEKVLDKFIQKGLKIGWGKCNFFEQQVNTL